MSDPLVIYGFERYIILAFALIGAMPVGALFGMILIFIAEKITAKKVKP